MSAPSPQHRPRSSAPISTILHQHHPHVSTVPPAPTPQHFPISTSPPSALPPIGTIPLAPSLQHCPPISTAPPTVPPTSTIPLALSSHQHCPPISTTPSALSPQSVPSPHQHHPHIGTISSVKKANCNVQTWCGRHAAWVSQHPEAHVCGQWQAAPAPKPHCARLWCDSELGAPGVDLLSMQHTDHLPPGPRVDIIFIPEKSQQRSK